MPDVYRGRTYEVFQKSLNEKHNIALETVFNDAVIKDWIDLAKNQGYHTRMIALFLNHPLDSLDRANQRRINENGIAISKDTVLLNFNENLKNVAQYYFYFDSADFIYTGTHNDNLNVMTFEGQTLARYQSNDFAYIKMFADYAYQSERLDKESYDAITLKNNYQKPNNT
jgi:predicted ABC-type ATPase